MKLIRPYVELMSQDYSLGIAGVYEFIEKVARTCYKSEDLMTGNSKEFVDRLIAKGHTAMLEHGTIYLQFLWPGSVCDVCNQTKPSETLDRYCTNPYSKVTYHGNIVYVTTNLRVLVENGWMDDLQYLTLPCFAYHQSRSTVKFVVDRAVAQEITRHRAFSFAMESQRFCNYSKDKFGNEITFIIPQILSDYTELLQSQTELMPGVLGEVYSDYDSPECFMRGRWLNALYTAEETYFELLGEGGWSPQNARHVLPNATKTELIVTGFEDDWKHFFDLRAKGTTGKPHPDMEHIAMQAMIELSY